MRNFYIHLLCLIQIHIYGHITAYLQEITETGQQNIDYDCTIIASEYIF